LPIAVRNRNIELIPARARASVKKTAIHRHFAIAPRDGGATRAERPSRSERDFFDTVWRADGLRHAKNADSMLFDAISSFQVARFAS
jgi:hypothetical protein